MTLLEAAKQALEALEMLQATYFTGVVNTEISKLRAVIEQAEKAEQRATPMGWQLINRTPTPQQRELLLRADEFTVDEMWIMLLSAAPQPEGR